MRRIGKLLAVTTGALCAVGGASVVASATDTPPPSTTTVSSAGPSQEWSACTDAKLVQLAAQCRYVMVPLDRTDVEAGRIAVAISRLPATGDASTYRGPLLVNPGGPGESGLAVPAMFTGEFGAGIRRDYDLIGFDPRGVGASSPMLNCKNARDVRIAIIEPVTAPDAEPGLNETTSLALAEDYVQDCVAANGDVLAHMTSTDVVADMDSIRATLGAETLNYYGFSYGTYLGQLYASTYPERVGRMVLDSNVDPTTWGYDAVRADAVGFEQAVQRFFAWVAEHDATYGLGDDTEEVETAYYAIDKILVERTPDELSQAQWRGGLLQVLYKPQAWPAAAQYFLLAHRAAGLSQGALPAAAPGEEPAAAVEDSDNSNAAYNAYSCGDSRWPAEYATWREDGFSLAEDAPFSAWRLVENYLPCLTWPYQKDRPEVDGSQAPPMLLTTREIDGATPLANSITVRTLFPGSVLVVSREVGHIASAQGNSCVNDLTLRYLQTGVLPPRISTDEVDFWCDGVPLPEPATAVTPEPASPGTARSPSDR